MLGLDSRRVPEIHIIQKSHSWFQVWHSVTNCTLSTKRTRRYSFIEDQLHHLIKTLILHLNSFCCQTYLEPFLSYSHTPQSSWFLQVELEHSIWPTDLALFTFRCLLWFQLLGALCFDCMSQKQSHYLPVSISTQLKHSLWFFSFSSNSCYLTNSAPRNSVKFDLTASPPLSSGCIPIMSSRKI